MTVLAWHFLYEGNKMRCGNIAPADGEWFEYKGNIELCYSGLHASETPSDALKYAPGPILCLVECDDIRGEAADKFVCSRRRIVARMDVTDMLTYYARMEALDALQYAPSLQLEDVVYDWLMTGDVSIKSAAWSAAWSAARSAAMSASESAAWLAAWLAARSAARSASESAAWSASTQRFDDLVFECFSDFLTPESNK